MSLPSNDIANQRDGWEQVAATVKASVRQLGNLPPREIPLASGEDAR